MSDTPAPVPPGSAALWYAQQGLRIFPLAPGQKTPMRGSHGLKDATTDPEQITTWWTHTPRANVGLATGGLVDVVDIDGPEGQASRAKYWCFDETCHQQGSAPKPPEDWTPICGHEGIFNKIEADCLGKVSTPRKGGMHLYVPATGGGNWAGKLPGVDYRGAKGYVVVPPSVTDAGSYTWLQPLTTPLPSPDTEGETG